MKYTPASIEGNHVVLTGPITGTVTLEDGSTVDVSAPVIEVADEAQAAEVADLIAQRYSDEGHPNVPVDDDHPEGFVYDAPSNTSKKG